jgi:hypothetical protein
MSRPEGQVSLTRLVEALNSLDPEMRAAAVAALRVHDPNTRYFLMRDGRVDAVRVDEEFVMRRPYG